jgi:exodeoxyribonuclease-3
MPSRPPVGAPADRSSPTPATSPPGGSVGPVQVVTWNVNSLKARLERVVPWIEANTPEVLCLQETKMTDDAFPASVFTDLGYQSAHVGEGRWNGVAIISRVGLDDVVAGFGDDDAPDPEARLVWATCAGVRVACAYVPNGRSLDNDHYTYKLAWLQRLRRRLVDAHDPAAPLVVTGDFNIAPDDRDVWDPAAFVGATHTSQPERDALAALCAWGLVDVFRTHHDEAGVFTWWDYRGGSFHKGHGMRIDLVLATPTLAERCTSVRIDREARKGKPTPSDHAPVLADFDLEA